MIRLARVLQRVIREPTTVVAALRIQVRLAQIRRENRASSAPVTGSGEVIVNLTSHGHRITSVFYAIESIAHGSVLPKRMILWLDDEDALASPPLELRRLQARGLEILRCDNFGPHKKQYAYAISEPNPTLPLAAADDDMLYPKDWLAELVSANRLHPEVINAMRTHTIVSREEATLAPYSNWLPGFGTRASYRVVCTGVSGIIYPPAMISAIKSEGRHFEEVAPRADDIWVHAVAVRHGIRSRQVYARQQEYPEIPGTAVNTLYRHNVVNGGNDIQIRATYRPEDIQRILADSPPHLGPDQRDVDPRWAMG